MGSWSSPGSPGCSQPSGAQDGPGGVLLPGGAGVDHRGEQPLGQGGVAGLAGRPRQPTEMASPVTECDYPEGYGRS